MNAPTIVFDGLCKFCNGWVRFVLKRDRERRFRFVTAQSAGGKALLKGYGLSPSDLSTVLFVRGGEHFVKSDAGIQILVTLGGVWRLVGAFRIVPRLLRDAIYVFTARNRYRIVGRYDACPLPPEDRREQFLT